MKKCVLLVVLLVASSAVQAFNVVFDPASDATNRVVTGITNLEVNVTGLSGIYNVSFTSDGFNTIQPLGGAPLYDAGASDITVSEFVDVIVAALNTTDANLVGNIGDATGTIFALPFTDDSLNVNNVRTFRGRYPTAGGAMGPWENFGLASVNRDSTSGLINVSLAVVPLPAGLPLLLTALGSLGFLARRRSAAG